MKFMRPKSDARRPPLPGALVSRRISYNRDGPHPVPLHSHKLKVWRAATVPGAEYLKSGSAGLGFQKSNLRSAPGKA
jgi:hypothetical protein